MLLLYYIQVGTKNLNVIHNNYIIFRYVCMCVNNLNNRIIFNIFSIICFEILNCLDALILARNTLSISYYDFHALRFHDHKSNLYS